MIFDRLGILLPRFARPQGAAATARRWVAARNAQPGIVADLIELGGVLRPVGAPLDPQRLAYEAGRRDLALELLALAQVDYDDLNRLTQE